METPPETPPEAEKQARQASVLVVDDDVYVRRSLRRILTRAGCVYLEAANAATAIEILGREKVHVVLSDYRMPGMDGVEFLRLVKERHPAVQRVLLTGQADTDHDVPVVACDPAQGSLQQRARAAR